MTGLVQVHGMKQLFLTFKTNAICQPKTKFSIPLSRRWEGTKIGLEKGTKIGLEKGTKIGEIKTTIKIFRDDFNFADEEIIKKLM